MADKKYECSEPVKQKIAIFTQADAAFRAAWNSFEEVYASQLRQLENLREERNARLDDARRALRDEATAADITKVKVISSAPFRVEKKWHSFYIPDKFVAKLEAKNLYDTAIAEKIVAEKVEVEKFEAVQQFLKKNGLLVDFEDCEDGSELTPAIYGPKPIAPFGTESKMS